MTVLIYPGNEHVIESAVFRLRQELNAAIGAINAAATDGITVDSPSPDRIFGYVPPLNEIVNYPALGVMELPSGGWTSDVGNDAQAEHSFAVVCYDMDPVQAVLVAKLRRMRQAVVSSIMMGRRMDHPTGAVLLGAWGLRYDGYRPGRTLGDADGVQSWTSFTSCGFTALAEDHPT